MLVLWYFFQAEDGIRDLVRSRGLGDVYKRQAERRINVRRGEQGFDLGFGQGFREAIGARRRLDIQRGISLDRADGQQVLVETPQRGDQAALAGGFGAAAEVAQIVVGVSYTQLTLPASDLV